MPKYHVEYFTPSEAFIKKEVFEAVNDNAAERAFKRLDMPYNGKAKLFSIEPLKTGKFGFDYPASKHLISERVGVEEFC